MTLNENEVGLILSYGKNFYADKITETENQIKAIFDSISLKLGTREVETGLAPPSTWNLSLDTRRTQSEQSLQVARVCKVIEGYQEPRYMIEDLIYFSAQEKCDVFNSINIGEAGKYLEELGFLEGSGELNYYLYNWKSGVIDKNRIFYYMH